MSGHRESIGAPPQTVLVVDDLADVRGLIGALLERRGYRVAEAEGGEQAVEEARRVLPDLILMDLKMPGVMDGVAAAHAIHGDLGLRDVPIVVVVLNNDGGGIFSFLPVAGQKQFFEPYFGTPQGVGFEPAAAMFGLAYEQPHTTGEFLGAYAGACASGVSSILEVRTDRGENVRLHAELLRLAFG